jgi:hypothetical protein
MRANLNDAVHYCSMGTARGEFPSRCYAADVVDTFPDEPGTVSLLVKKPWGLEHRNDVTYDEGVDVTPAGHGPTDYCDGRDHQPGTWHWSHA